MSLLVSDELLAARASVVAGPLQPLADSLARDLEPLLSREIFFPREKALLSREGGRCAKDGTLLAFDPFAPTVHRCPRCGASYQGELHYRFWIYWYQLWFAERAVHAAALARLGVDRRFGALAAAILDGYAARYVDYPNVDNVLGPTRLFFSTYLESIWLLQICVATDLIEPLDPALAGRVRDRIIAPSRAIIGDYDEGGSNRQVWNDAALLAAACSLGDGTGADRVIHGPSGIVEQLSTGLLADGTWYEGDNYHLFAHRGLWYGVTMAEQAGAQFPRELVERFQRGFSTIFATALPDFTFPSRRDSQYAVSLRQWRTAEHVELGLARRVDETLIGALERMYRDDIPRRETGRVTSSADAERNGPASALTRADLSWRALLCARSELPPLVPVAPCSALLERQGLAVFRRQSGRTYVALDYGHSGGGHGHPDRLNLLLVDGDMRWLDDFGTGSYVEDVLHWYRSTLAHNAPLVDGRSQPAKDGILEAYEERDGEGWIEARFSIDDVEVRRTVVVLDGYLIDEVTWRSPRSVQLDLPMHADVAFEESAALAAFGGEQGLEDGFRFAHTTSASTVDARRTMHGTAVSDGQVLNVWTHVAQPAELWRAIAPGPPGHGDRAFRVWRSRAEHGRITSILAWSGDVAGVDVSDTITISRADGSLHRHRRAGDRWRIERGVDAIELGGRVVFRETASPSPSRVQRSLTIPATVELGELHYRRSEQSWVDAGRPSAVVTIHPVGEGLRIEVRVATSDHTFVPADATNPYDNEAADVNGDGIQLFIRTAKGKAGWMLVPESGSDRVRVRAIDGWRSTTPPKAVWQRGSAGYAMTIDLSSTPDSLDLIVNEKPAHRERRRGQLVLSGGGGFIYLRGDRHDESALLRLDRANG